MPEILCFTRNRSTGVERIDERTMRSVCRLQDTVNEAFVEIEVRLPDMEVVSVKGEMRRSPEGALGDVQPILDKLIGVRIGSGMTKIIDGLVADEVKFAKLAYMVQECCHGVILSFTKGTLKDVPDDPEQNAAHFRQMVKKNIRLYNRCAAFAPGSAIVSGIEPPYGD